MIETLILGFLLGFICTGAGATYAAYRLLKQPYIVKDMRDGYTLIAGGIGVNDDPNGYIGLKKDNTVIAALRYNEKGVTDIVYDI